MKVAISEELKELIPGYLANKAKEVEKMKVALKAQDFDTICTIGHGMKGSGGGYGFDFITDVGHKIETSARDQSSDNMEGYFSELLNYINNVEIEYV